MKKLRFNEIGSNLFNEHFISKNKTELPKNNDTYLDSGRNAIRLVLNSIKTKNKKALLPAYTCNTVVEPFIENDYQIEYYDINKNFLIDKEEFKNKVEKWKPNVILVHSYFGKDTIKNVREYLKELKNKNIYIIEDVTQLLLQDKIDTSIASFILGSIRKWCAVPDGGFVKNNTDIKLNIENCKENSEFVAKQLKAFERKREYSKTLEEKTKEEYLKLYSEAKDILDSNDKEIFLMSENTKEKLSVYDFEKIKEQRRNNYNYLYDNLKVRGAKNQLGKLDKDETPLYFPIFIDSGKRKEFQNFMTKEKIYCPIIWPKDKNIDIKNYKCKDIYESIICIPCDQRYTEKDMERVVKAIKFFLKEG